MQLNLLADDGTVVERPFEASIFTGRGYKGMFRLEKDAERLLAAESADELVALVGRFKEDKRKGANGEAGGYTFQARFPFLPHFRLLHAPGSLA